MGSPTENQPHATPWRDLIKVHEACDLVPPMTDEELQGLAADIQKQGKEGRILAPIAVWRGCENEPWQLLDGRNRLDAAATLPNGEALIQEAIRLPIHKGPETDPYAYVLSLNLHRRHLSIDHKREIAAALLKADPSKSDRRVAAEAGLNRNDVGVERKKLEKAGDVSFSDTRTDTKGRQQPATKLAPSELAQIRALREQPAPRPPPAAVVENTAAAVLLVDEIEGFRARLKEHRLHVERIDRSIRIQLARGLMVALGIAPAELGGTS